MSNASAGSAGQELTGKPANRRSAAPGDVENRLRLLRRYDRTIINVRAVVHAGLSAQQTIIRDMSEGGVGLTGAAGLYPGTEVRIALVTGDMRTGIVRWWLAGSCGIQFHEPLRVGDAFREAAMRRAKSLGAANLC
ncbi:MAG: PilZ domain-containing protein [Hyphomicrobiaceae bacterium]